MTRGKIDYQNLDLSLANDIKNSVKFSEYGLELNEIYYFSKSGDDENSGSKQSPKLNLGNFLYELEDRALKNNITLILEDDYEDLSSLGIRNVSGAGIVIHMESDYKESASLYDMYIFNCDSSIEINDVTFSQRLAVDDSDKVVLNRLNFNRLSPIDMTAINIGNSKVSINDTYVYNFSNLLTADRNAEVVITNMTGRVSQYAYDATEGSIIYVNNGDTPVTSTSGDKTSDGGSVVYGFDKVKMDKDDKSGYLGDKIDNKTIIVDPITKKLKAADSKSGNYLEWFDKAYEGEEIASTYFANNGNDDNDGLTPTTPKKDVNKYLANHERQGSR